jgi:hypothetical protein
MHFAGRRRRKMVYRGIGCLAGLDFPAKSITKTQLAFANGACLGGGGKGEYELLITNE